MVKVKYSTNFDAVRMRIKRLPELAEEMALATVKKDAVSFIKLFKQGIRDKKFNLIALRPETIRRKMRQGLSQPSSPLYGSGDDEKNSYINTLRLRRLRKGWKVYRSNAKHHDADITLKHLMAIHEAGALIKRGDAIIRIPPRPTFKKAFNWMLKEKSRQENVAEAKRAINIYIKTGDYSKINNYRKILKGKDFEN